MKIFPRLALYAIAFSLLVGPCLASTEPAEATIQVFVLKGSRDFRAALDLQLKKASAADAGRVFLAALDAGEIKVEAMSALTAKSGNQGQVKSRVSLQAVPVIGTDSEEKVAVTCTVEFDRQKIEIENTEYRSGEARLFAFPESGPADEKWVAVVRVLRSSGGDQ